MPQDQIIWAGLVLKPLQGPGEAPHPDVDVVGVDVGADILLPQAAADEQGLVAQGVVGGQMRDDLVDRRRPCLGRRLDRWWGALLEEVDVSAADRLPTHRLQDVSPAGISHPGRRLPLAQELVQGPVEAGLVSEGQPAA